MGAELSTIVCVWAYCPVRMDALLGEQSAVLTKAFLTWIPSRAMRSILGVSNPGIFPIKPMASYRWSSARINTTFSGFAPETEEHTSELQSLMRISYAVFCLKKKKKHNHQDNILQIAI